MIENKRFIDIIKSLKINLQQKWEFNIRKSLSHRVTNTQVSKRTQCAAESERSIDYCGQRFIVYYYACVKYRKSIDDFHLEICYQRSPNFYAIHTYIFLYEWWNAHIHNQYILLVHLILKRKTNYLWSTNTLTQNLNHICIEFHRYTPRTSHQSSVRSVVVQRILVGVERKSKKVVYVENKSKINSDLFFIWCVNWRKNPILVFSFLCFVVSSLVELQFEIRIYHITVSIQCD